MFNPFNKTKKTEKKAKPKPNAERVAEKKEIVAKASVVSQGKYPPGIVIAPRITEKATMLAQNANQYVFEVSDKANAGQIKHVIEKKYGVRVENVNVLNQPGKKVRLGRKEGWRKGFKKAFVTLSKGQSIELT